MSFNHFFLISLRPIRIVWNKNYYYIGCHIDIAYTPLYQKKLPINSGIPSVVDV